MAQCNECKLTFSNEYNLRAHVKRKHSDKLDILCPRKRKPFGSGDIKCKECGKSFTRLDNLRSHIKQKHSDKSEELVACLDKQYICEECGNQFHLLGLLKKHKESHKAKKIIKIRCPLCDYVGSSRDILLAHYTNLHNFKIETEIYEFESLEAFQSWKSEMERRTFSSFIKKRTKTINQAVIKIEHYCHRSGHFKARGANIRPLKTKGTNKINGYCPANLKVILKNGKYFVYYCATHVGHKQEEDLDHLFLTKAERDQIAAKIASKVPLQVILNEIKDSISNCQLQRLHLLTKKDLYNIEKSYNLNASSVRHKNDAISVEAWVNKLQSNNCILFYKRQDSDFKDYPELKKEDFLLIVMTDGQKELLINFGNDCVCIDRTHGLNGYGFELHTLLVLDDTNEGYPCAFLVSNRSDVAVFKIFFKCIEEKIEYKIKPNVFMSDMADAYYSAWLQVMYPANSRLLCSWHVDRAWRKNLDKILQPEKKVHIYKILRSIMQERDINAFFKLQDKFLLFLNQSVETLEFAQYFKEYFMSKPELWAYCFRLNSGINTNLHIERMHRTIKHIYLHGKFVKRLDKAIDGIMKFVRDKLFERVTILHKGKVSTKLSDLRHRVSETMDIGKVIYKNLTWTVASSSTNELYAVEEVKLDCTCTLICIECNACIHRFSCTCVDNSIKWNMCKHIHLVCRYMKQLPKAVIYIDEGSFLAESNLVMDINTKDQEVSGLVETQPKKQNSFDPVIKKKRKLLKEMVQLQEELKLVNSIQEIEIFERNLSPIMPSLVAVRSHNKSLVGFSEVSGSKKK